MRRSFTAVLLCLLILACEGDDDDTGFNRGEDPSDDDDAYGGDDDDAADDDDDDGECAAEPLTGTPNVVETEDLGGDWWGCYVSAEDAPRCACVEGYTGLTARAPEFANPITAEQLDEEMREVDPDLGGSIDGAVQVLTGPTDPSELADELVNVMGVCGLREGMMERELTVASLGETVTADYIQRDLRFEDPFVGQFGAMLLLPPGDGPFPAVIALGGHGDTMEEFRDTYHGDFFPAEDIAILIPVQRGICVDENEDLAARQLLLGGFTMVGVRMYEVMLALKYLHHIPEVDGDRVGLIGHSTGSVVGNGVVRTLPGVKAWVTDLFGVYFSFVNNPLIDNTMAPRLYPYHQLINDMGTMPIPAIEVGYGFGTANEDDPQQPNSLPEILEFFDQNL